MGQVFFQDNIPTVVRASSTGLTMAATNNGQPTRITIGGQQYAATSTLSVNTPSSGSLGGLDTGSLGALQLWYVYAVNGISGLALIASLAVPSVGPLLTGQGAGTAYKLVGAFYTDGASTVGSMVNISGVAQTEWFSFTPTGTWITNTTYLGKCRRQGDLLQIMFDIALAGAPTSTTLSLNIPAIGGGVIDTSKYASGTASLNSLGKGEIFRSGTGRMHLDVIGNSTANTVTFESLPTSAAAQHFVDVLNATQPVTFASGDHVFGEFFVPISGWSNTLL